MQEYNTTLDNQDVNKRAFIYTCPDKVFHDTTLTINELKIYMMVRSFIDSTGDAYPSNNWLAKKLNIHRTTAINALNTLAEKGYLYKTWIGGQRHLSIINPDCISQVVAPPLPPSSVSTTPPSSVSTTQLDQSNITSKNINIYINAEEKNLTLSPNNLVESIPEKNKVEKDMYPDNYYMEGKQLPEVKKEVAVSKPVASPMQAYAPTSQVMAEYGVTKEQATTFETLVKHYPRKARLRRAQALWFSGGCHECAKEIFERLAAQIKRDARFLDGLAPNLDNYIQNQQWNDEVYEKKKGHFDYESKEWAKKLAPEEDFFGEFS